MESSKCEDIIEYMHEFLDGDLPEEKVEILRDHLRQCDDCRRHFHELKKTIALVQSLSHIQAPAGFTSKVMSQLPREKKNIVVKRWLSKHPFLVAAAVFILLMAGSFLSNWSMDREFSVTKYPDLMIENNTAIVPEGVVIEGDLVVKNGNLRIDGKVNGNVTVINGKILPDDSGKGGKYLASAGKVTGDIEEIDRLFEWLWYSIKNVFD
jgi:hypothetical protein